MFDLSHEIEYCKLLLKRKEAVFKLRKKIINKLKSHSRHIRNEK